MVMPISYGFDRDSFDPDLPDDCDRPNPLASLRELAAPLEWFSSFRRAPILLGAPKGDQEPVLTIPGYLTGDASMAPLNRFLRFVNYRVYSSGIGLNRGKVDADVQRIGERVMSVRQKTGEPVTVIGWSLGGVLARELARLYEDDVRGVITLGTPIIGGPKYTSVGDLYARAEQLDLDEFEREVHRRNSLGLKQPVTSIFTKSDGIVGWKASIDIYNEQAKNICVESTHLGLGLNPRVWRIIADVLAGRETQVPT
ncbi:MAG: alpha/beta hydrolase, partial [Pseudomonadota bacterium]